MSANPLFLSYSRKQLYFAEALSLVLEEAGFDTWMDLQQLGPGSDWQDEIDRELRNCRAMVLVVSRQALASPYVESEWRAILAPGKLIYIACYEEVSLPPELQSASLVDFRGPFNKAAEVLAAALKTMSTVRDHVPPPNRLGLPRRMPPMVMLIAGLLVFEASFPLIRYLFTEFLLRSSFGWFQLANAAVPLWMAWLFLHHRFVIGASRFAFVLIVVTFLFPQFGGAEVASQFWSFMSCSLQALFVILAVYILEKGRFGEELLRWSAPGDNQDARILRRRLNKRQPVSDDQAESVYRQVLAARNLEQKPVSSAKPPGAATVIPPAAREAGAPGYSLHFAAADDPTARSLRNALKGQSLQEVDSNAQVQIVLLSEHFPRSKLQELLDSGDHVIPILIGNIAFEGDALLGRAASLQLIDYRDRSKSILSAFAETLKKSPKDDLHFGFETFPQPLNTAVLPTHVPLMGLVVFNIGSWLIVSGLVSLFQSLLLKTPAPVLNLAGSVCGFLFLKWTKDFLQRKSTNFRILPVALLSSLLIGPLYLGPFLLIAEMGTTDTLPVWTITLSLLLSNGAFWTCLLCPGGLFVLGAAILWKGDWLPAFVPLAEDGDVFKPLARNRIQQSLWLALLLGTFNTFVPALIYALVQLFRQSLQN